MNHLEAIVIGGGQAGLATSRCLTDLGVEHVVLERGRIAESWRSERWDSLRVLTPNWQSRLPAFSDPGPDPHGFRSMPEVTDLLVRYAQSFDAPVRTGTTVERLERHPHGFRVRTDRGDWTARTVVLATGAFGTPWRPGFASALAPDIVQLAPTRYRNPASLQPGGVLVVGASASGVQLARELVRAGRSVTLGAGRHTRLPRRYRGRDIQFWLDRLGYLDRRFEEVRDLRAARDEPSLQLVGGTEDIDLGTLQREGVEVVGRVRGIDGARVSLSQDLSARIAAADARQRRVLSRIDAHIERNGLDLALGAVPADISVPIYPDRVDLRDRGIRNVIWATGFRPRYPWLRVPGALDTSGAIRHTGGVSPVPGLYVLGLPFLRRRKSTYIDGAGADACELALHLHRHLRNQRAAA